MVTGVCVIVFLLVLFVWPEIGSKEEPLDNNKSYKEVLSKRRKPKWYERVFGFLLLWRSVYDNKNRLWIYKEFRGSVIRLESTGLQRITQEQYNEIFKESR